MNKGKLTTLLSNTALVPSLAVVFGTVATYFGLNIDQTTLITILGFIIGLIIAYFDIDNPEYTEPKPIEEPTIKVEVDADKVLSEIEKRQKETPNTTPTVDDLDQALTEIKEEDEETESNDDTDVDKQ